jgi:hypothetical protein
MEVIHTEDLIISLRKLKVSGSKKLHTTSTIKMCNKAQSKAASLFSLQVP